MKVTIIVDKQGSAIHRLALAVQQYNPHLKIAICDVHPKRPDKRQLTQALKHIAESDLVDVHYWKSGEVLQEQIKDKKKILFHFNPYDTDKQNWSEYDALVVPNEEMRISIPAAHLIPLAVDLNFFTFSDTYTESKKVLMVASRIESSKGILEAAQATQKAGYEFVLAGRISDRDYFNEVQKYTTEFYENITDEALKDLYYNAALLICNSKDNFESGTLPVLEAMASGVPVLSRPVGHVPDLFDSKNLMLIESEKEDVEHIAGKIQELMQNRNLRVKLREEAWQTVKRRGAEKMARQVSNLYYKTVAESDPFVSIIIPTFDRPKVFAQTLLHAVEQDYKFKEIIVADSGTSPVKELVDELKRHTDVPIKYIYFDNKGEFTLPKARNLAVIESQGEYLLFDDERMIMHKNALSEFVKCRQNRSWLYGLKNEVKKGFVENFSFVKRRDLIAGGMFNERIDCYGGASEELRERFSNLGFTFERINTAHADVSEKSSSRWGKKDQIVRAKYIIDKLYNI